MSAAIQKNPVDNYERHPDQSLTTYVGKDVKILSDTIELFDKLPIKGIEAVKNMDLSKESLDSILNFGDHLGFADIVDGKSTVATGDYKSNKSKLDPTFKEKVGYKVDGVKDILRGINKSYHKWTDNFVKEQFVNSELELLATGGAVAGLIVGGIMSLLPFPGGGAYTPFIIGNPTGTLKSIALLIAGGIGSGTAIAIAENKDKNEKIMYELKNRPFLEKIGAIPKQD